MWPFFSHELEEMYAGDDLRQLAHKTLEEFEERWAKEGKHLAHPQSGPALRDAKCAEALMMWTHHVPEAGKHSLRDLILPTLAEFNMDHIEKGHRDVADRYASSYTCVTGHNAQSGHTSDHVWPHWPKRFTMRAEGTVRTLSGQDLVARVVRPRLMCTGVKSNWLKGFTMLLVRCRRLDTLAAPPTAITSSLVVNHPHRLICILQRKTSAASLGQVQV